MESIKLLARNGEALRQALELGEILHLETASEELTDEFLLFASKSGLLDQWADAFPDPRQWSEISMKVIIRGRARRTFCRTLQFTLGLGYVRERARVLGELGDAVEVVEAGDGISSRGPADDSRLRGDSMRKLLVKLESRVEPVPQAARAGESTGCDLRRSRSVRGRSRRAVAAGG